MKLQFRGATRPLFHPEQHFTALGELHGIAQKIHQHLAQPVGITRHLTGNRGIDFERQFQVFLMRPQRHRAGGLLQQFSQVERLGIEVHLSGLDFGEIQNVVNHCQKRVGGFSDAFHVFLLHRANRSVERQLCHADDAVHGSPQFVAHVRHKLALKPAGFLGLIHQVQQFAAGGVELFHHVVECDRQIVHFVPGTERCPLLQITMRYQPGEVDQPNQRAEQPP